MLVITEGYKINETSIFLYVRLSPKASMDKIAGWVSSDDGKTYLHARVRALPDKGAANKALLGLLAKNFGIAKGQLKVRSGAKSHLKTIEISDTRVQIIEQLKQM